MSTIRIPTPLRTYTAGKENVDVRGGTVAEALDDLARQYPDLREHLFNDGKLRSFVNVFLGDEDIRYLDGVATRLKEGDRLMIVPSIAGGAARKHEPG
ncbi:MAG: MoaD/ThiS family protein [Anaerolineae bacterium]|nr:MoaD/ThiS family protein [Anaerolineae bacterium]